MGFMILVWIAIGTAVLATVLVAQVLRSRRMRRIASELDTAEPGPRPAARTRGTRPIGPADAGSEARLP